MVIKQIENNNPSSLSTQAKEGISSNKKSIKTKSKKAKSNGIKKYTPQIKSFAKASILYSLSFIINSQIKNLSRSNQKLSEMVDETNKVISNIKTKQDIEKAKRLRDNAILKLNDNEKKLDRILQIIKTLGTIATVFQITLFIILLIPFRTFPKTVNSIYKLTSTIESLIILPQTLKPVILGLIDENRYNRERLLLIKDILDKIIDDNLTSEEIQDMLNKSNTYSQLGVIDGTEYKGFKFALYEENNPDNEVKGIKRKYAVALDRSGFIVLYSNYSYTLDPQILIEELKIQIDNKKLEA